VSNQDNYWTRTAGRQYGRRAILRGAAVTGAGLAGAIALACGGGSKKSTSSTSGPGQATQAAQAQANQPDALAGLVGRNGKNPQGETPVRGGTFVMGFTGNPVSLDPQLAVNVNTTIPASAVYSRLYRFKTSWDVAASNNKEIEPDLASGYEAVDAATWTYKLRPDAKFHNVAPVNGHPVTSADIKASFTRAVAPTSATRGSLLMIDPNKIETPDANTVVFKLNYPYAPFPKAMASSIFAYILPREATEGGFEAAKKMIGSGPFMMESYTPDVSLIFKRNPEWYEKGRPYIDGVKVAIVPDPAQRMAQFTAGNLDYLQVPTPNDVPSMIQQNPKAEVVRNVANANGIMYFQLLDQNSIFQDIRVRQAASLAADRGAYGKAHFGEKYLRTFNVNPDFGKWVISWDELPQETKQFYDADLAKAKQLMEAAGGNKLSIKMVYPLGNPAEPLLKETGETILSMLKALPWNLTFVPVDYLKDWQPGAKAYGYGGLPGDSMAWWGTAQRSDVDEFLYGFWHTKGSTNISRLSDPKLDGMIDKARAILSEEERLKAYKEVQKYILDNVYCLTGMVNGPTTWMTQPRLHNWTIGDAFGLGANTWTQMWIA
jgi:peptide/nickel transport system substrate-binding protein